MIAPNILLAFLVVISLYSNTEQLLWMSLISGLMADLYSSSDFGFYLGFFILTAIVSKYVLKFGEIEFSWWRPLVFLAMVSAIQALVVGAGFYSASTFWNVTNTIISYVVLTVLSGVIWYLILSQIDEFIKRLILVKANR